MHRSAPSSLWALVVFDIDGVVRDVSGSYRRAIADTVEHFTQGSFRPTSEAIDQLKSEGCWNNDWKASQALIERFFAGQGQAHQALGLQYDDIVAFFQGRYRGVETNPEDWSGYITQEPILMHLEYLNALSEAGIGWGFFSGATRGSANYILEKRLKIVNPVLVAMEDAPGKPDPTGLFAAISQLETRHHLSESVPVIYVGDTVADLYTISQARQVDPTRTWYAVGVLPPHVQETTLRKEKYRQILHEAGADIVLDTVEALDSQTVSNLLRAS